MSFSITAAARNAGRYRPRRAPRRARAVLATLAVLAPGLSWACACGCGVFDVGTGAMFPDGAGGIVYSEVDVLNQNRNWSGTSPAPAAGNPDKQIRSTFYTLGGQYLFNRSWGISVDVPYWDRTFRTTDPATGELLTFRHAALGDIRIRGLYTGFSADLSSGISFGLKLPSGDSSYANFDPDTEISSGSTDLLLGAYHLGRLAHDGSWNYFVRALLQQPLQSKATYRPGNELIGVVGTYYHGWTFGPANRIVPMVQLTAAYRGHDGGPMAHPEDSGYRRLVVAPGLEVGFDRLRLYAEAGFAVHDDLRGNQLEARQLYKLSASYAF